MINNTGPTECPRDDVAAYVDNELSAEETLGFEQHTKVCAPCRKAVQEQKIFLAALSVSLSDDSAAQVPDELTRKFVVNAESSVVGLRHWNERFTVLFISLALLIFTLFAFGSEANASFSIASAVSEKAIVFVGFIGKILMNLGAAASVVVRSLASNIGFQDSAIPILLAGSMVAVFVLGQFFPGRKNA
ncbi:MAG TPA: zf-HC2 domain-containing protein [Pyrinomonadaceae bacterium]|nr:zf-HC2 domain-containing protein [Pyrinomonadaceae bacterium]